MKRIALISLFFLGPPVAILIVAILHRPPAFEGRLISEWFYQIKIGQPSPGVAAFQRMGSAAVPVLQKALKSDDVTDRLKAAWTLGQLGPVASNAIPDLILCLDNPFNNLPIFALQSLATIAPAQVDAIPKLLSQLSSPNAGVSNVAADLLAKIEQERKAGNLPMYADEYEYTLCFLRSSAQRVRIIGLQRLMRLSPKDERVVATFKSLLNDTNSLVRSQSAMFLNNHEG